MVWGKLDIHMQTNEIGPYLIPITKINLKWIKGFSTKPEIIKLEEKGVF